MRQTLESARVDRARGVAVLTQDDMANIETGIVLLEMLGIRVPRCRSCCAFKAARWAPR